MVLKLHVWGPTFGLPSIDPSCIATVAYFHRFVPRDQWTLVADHDTALSPQGEFPLLFDADEKITGFTNVVSYLRDRYAHTHDLDENLTPQQQQRTDQIALTSFLESSAGPLVDLYLYISSENYNNTTTAAYTAILPWFANYTIPPKRRDLARSRTAHLGLSSLDVAEASEDTQSGPGRGTASSEYEAAKRAAGIPTDGRTPALNMGRGKGLLGSPIYTARFKLDALSSQLLQPLADQLGNKKYMFGGDKPSGLDCLAFGYLALLRYAPVPQAWVRETMETKFPKIHSYVGRLREELLYNEDVGAADVWSIATGKAVASDLGMQLPWASRSPRATLPQVLGAVHDSVLPHALQRDPIVRHGTSGSSKSQPSVLPSPFAINTLVTVTSAVAVGLTALAIHYRRSPRDGALIFWALRPLQPVFEPVFEGFGVDSFLKQL